MAKWFGWTLDYVDSLDVWDIMEAISVMAELNKVE